jgi:hypothetical protein
VVTRFSSRPVRRIITVSDAERYGERGDDEQRDLQNWMADIQDAAARNAGLDRQQAFIQGTGDGSVTAWPPEASDLDLLVDYLRELHDELLRVNGKLIKGSKIRLRLAVSAGIVEEAAQGITGQAVIRASLLANSDELREALRNTPGCPLAVILDGPLYEDVVRTRRRTLREATYERVVIRDKYGVEHVAWITVPGSRRRKRAAASSSHPGGGEGATSGGGQPGPRGGALRNARKKRLLPIPVIVALIGAAGAITAAAIAAEPGPSPNAPSSPHTSSASTPSNSMTTPTASSGASSSEVAGGLRWEQADNHLGTDVFRDPMGDAVASGPVSIPFGTRVLVKCWARNESDMGSINAFYLIETRPWAGEYAPANTFLNADTTGALDPEVHQCLTA